MSQPLAYLNGRIVPAFEARLNIYDLGVVLGATVTEMVRTFHRRLFRLEDHLGRLARSLKYVRFDIGMTMAELGRIVTELVEHNARLLAPEQELALVVFVTAGENRVYAGSAGEQARQEPTICAHTFPLPFATWARQSREGVHLVVPSTRHVPPQCIDPNVKYRSRLHYYLAEQEARLVDPEAVPLLLDLEGNVTETSGANVLLVEGPAIVSPPRGHILPGISRQVVIELAGRLGLPFHERPLKPFDVIHADEALLASTPYCLLSAVRINGLPIGQGRPGPVFHRLMAAWSQEVGLDILKQIEAGAPCEPSSSE